MKKLLSLLLLVTLFSCGLETKEYHIEIHYCDNKPSETITVISHSYPKIQTYKQAVPVYTTDIKNYVNVCDLIVTQLSNR